MFSVQVTGKITREFEKKDGKFGAAATYAIETKNKKAPLERPVFIQFNIEDLNGKYVFKGLHSSCLCC